MKNKKYKKSIMKFVFSLSFLLCFFAKTQLIWASSTIGTIDNVYKFAKETDTSGTTINFGLFTGKVPVVVTDSSISGFGWSKNIGWINLSPAGGGVLNNGEGVLSGYATSQFGGLINFKPEGSGVIINSSGDFLGYASSENFGLISFNCINDNSCDADDYKVKTDWRPISVRGEEKKEVPPIIKVMPPVVVPVSNVTNSNLSQSNTNNSQIGNSNSSVGHTEPQVQDNVNNFSQQNLPVDNIISSLAQDTVKASTFIGQKSKEIKKEAMMISETPAVSVSTKAVTTVGVAGGGTAIITSLLGSTVSFSEFILNFLRIWSLFLSAIGLRKKTKPWGTVYDSVTKQPLDPAYVVLQDKDNKEIATAITDFDGRFGFLVTEGAYKIYVRKNNYSFPSKKLFGKKSDELYGNIYFGEFLDLQQDELIIRNIPMDPEKFDWNEFTKKDKKLLKFSSPYANIFSKISNILFYLGFILALILLIVNTYNYYNLAIIFLYWVLFTLRMFGLKPKSYGIITERDSLFPLSFAVIRIFSKDHEREIFHRVSDKYGRYYCLLPKGEYYIKIEKKNDDESYSNVYTSEILNIKKGILNKDFKV